MTVAAADRRHTMCGPPVCRHPLSAKSQSYQCRTAVLSLQLLLVVRLLTLRSLLPCLEAGGGRLNAATLSKGPGPHDYS